jgi:hypothetical protein
MIFDFVAYNFLPYHTTVAPLSIFEKKAQK